MRHVALALILAAATTASASQAVPMVAVQDGPASCVGFDPAKLSVVQIGQDWRVTVADSNGFTVALLSSKADADAALNVIQKRSYTATCTIGRGARNFRYFDSAR